jgi:glycine/D-amino acid oxidase-like deaminating enzyme/nitrite reductase/ring-hydroxylating ferredoxin subunit
MTSLWLADATPIPTDGFERGAHYDEVIVGAGITGLVAALLFARQGRRVAVLEARTVGAVTTGNTTAKLSQLQGTQFTKIRALNPQRILQAYADGNREAFDWLVDYAEARGIELERRDAYTYAATPEGLPAVTRENELARSVGLDVTTMADAGLPFPTLAAVRMRDQAQLDPMELLASLAQDVRDLGGRIVEGARVLGVRAASSPAHVTTSLGGVTADHVILATGTPILNRGLYFTKVAAERSYAQSFALAEGELPDGMFLGVESPTRSIRSWRGQLLTGGNGHPVGREASPQSRADDLANWTREYWPGAVQTHSWSAQDYSPMHHVPFVGWFPRGFRRIYLATGYDKWGMTGGIAAGLTLVADILGTNTQWQSALHRRPTLPPVIARGIGEVAAVGWWYAKGWAGALGHRLPADAPAEGSGVVGRGGMMPRAISTVDGLTCELSAVCTHLAAVVTWNDAERSWDCPAHGSRFAADGAVFEGPARRALKATGEGQ